MRRDQIVARHKTRAEDGTVYVVLEIEAHDFRRTVNGELIDLSDGEKKFQLDDGSYVHPVDANTFLIFNMSQKVRKIE
ncbi:MAG: hypothetical protein E5W28_04345 [Mesorhizobium sp.]|uniref:hypothetical protein n=1 Tax=Mesorhizobium sp. TaxID=1871066 RepID=UPI000FE7EFCB|nr:hypothetical protein [Mesorhizobium sp.]RWE84215.1 MAG: hypothetical protein EOS63_03585 [Mesorhizobium sp.]TIU39782.1 MAG: hypothetical protein E5W28_04345 [Mesorhizobium sp.]TJW64617.1 MAG: hypothetical protein E5V97_06370 [Mesorhizobium sp.]